MLLYNSQKEFIGIEEQDVKILGFSDVSQLLALTNDFADLFIKEPGYIHNFKHIHWIDFITCSNDSESPKALIGVNSKSFKCTIEIKTLFLNDAPSTKAYAVYLQNLREIGKVEESASSNLTPIVPPHMPKVETPVLVERVAPISIELPPQELSYVREEPIRETVSEVVAPLLERVEEIEEEEASYEYDPFIASNELGLPVELIEEFIQDFKAQTEEFRADLYQSFEEGDMKNVKTLSHKLKGVAANLRIEDALEVLTNINTSDNHKEIKANIDRLYKIIAKHTSEKKAPVKAAIKSVVASFKEDDMLLDFKDEHVHMPEIKTTKIEFDEDDLILDFKYAKEDASQEIAEPLRGYDKEQAAHEIGIDLESFNELFDDYIFECKALLETIHGAIQENNLGMCKMNAIKLKGMSDNMRVHGLKPQLEDLADAQDALAAQEALEKVERFMSDISHKS